MSGDRPRRPTRRYGPDFFIAVLAIIVAVLLVAGAVWQAVA